MTKRHAFVLALLDRDWLACSSLAAAAQGLQTGTLQGTVKDQSDAVLPGVTVSVTSPGLQGTRETVTDGNGVYTHSRAAARRLHECGSSCRAWRRRTGEHRSCRSAASRSSTRDVDFAVTEVVNVTAQTSNALAVPTGQTNLDLT